jgi:hypothetical protein
MIQEPMERRVVPFRARLFCKRLELLQIFLRNQVACLLIGWIAIVHATAERPRFSGGAEVFLLKRTKLGRDRLTVSGRAGQQDLGFQIAYEQYMAILLETAASATGNADRPRGGDFGVHLLVQIQDFSLQFCAHGFSLRQVSNLPALYYGKSETCRHKKSKVGSSSGAW